MSVKKSWPHDAPIRFYVRKSEKKWRFWKNEAQNRVGIFWQNPIFWAETFFQRPLENFLLAWRTCSRYLKGPPNLVLCVSKKIVTIRHTNKKIFANNRQKTPFLQTSFGTTVVKSRKLQNETLFSEFSSKAGLDFPQIPHYYTLFSCL